MSLERLLRICPLLERETRTKVLDYAPPPWVLKQCLESKFVFLENPPTYSHFEEEFAWEATSKKESDARKQGEPVLYAVSTGLKKFRGRVLKRNRIRSLSIPLIVQRSNSHPDLIRILDVGCGWGGLLRDITSHLAPDIQVRCVPYGIEISRELARIATDNFTVGGGECVNDTALSGLGKLPIAFLDLIIMSSFLEHEINPLPLLRTCYERLKPGGSVVVKVPNYACINRSVRGARWCGFRWPDHVNYFTPATLAEISRKARLVVARMNWFDRHPFSDNMYAILRRPFAVSAAQ